MLIGLGLVLFSSVGFAVGGASVLFATAGGDDENNGGQRSYNTSYDAFHVAEFKWLKNKVAVASSCVWYLRIVERIGLPVYCVTVQIYLERRLLQMLVSTFGRAID